MDLQKVAVAEKEFQCYLQRLQFRGPMRQALHESLIWALLFLVPLVVAYSFYALVFYFSTWPVPRTNPVLKTHLGSFASPPCASYGASDPVVAAGSVTFKVR